MVFRRDLMDRSVELAGITSAWGDPLLPALNKNFDNVTTPRADVFHTITQQEFGSILNPTILLLFASDLDEIVFTLTETIS